jgi:uncharacterized protein (DUF433 family)
MRRDEERGGMSEIVATEDTLGGEPRIEGRRIGVLHVATRVIDGGEPPEAVAADFDLDLADVHRALAYYYDHPEEMQEWRRRKREAGERARENQPDPSESGKSARRCSATSTYRER